MTEPIPMVDLRRHGLDAELRAAFERVLTSGRYIGGPEVEAFEHECAAFLGVAHAIGVSSGTDALLVSLMALGVGPGDEVIVPTYTFFATAGVVARLGATPVFVDICPRCFNIDPAAIEIRERTKAIIAVHLFGQSASMKKLREVAGDVPIIEDAAQSFGARTSASGVLASHSFFPSKNLGGFGDGGMVVTDDPGLADRVRLLRDHGAKPKYHHAVVGGNFRLDALQAALLRAQLPHVQARLDARQRAAARYDELLAGLALESPGRCAPHHTFNQYVVRFHDEAARDQARSALAADSIASAIYYPKALHLQPCFASLGHGAGSMPRAEAASLCTLAIPLFPEIRPDEQERVARALRTAVRERR